MSLSKIKTVYTTCVCNCGGTSSCVIKAHVKDGRVVRVEPDDRYNPGVGMEDRAISFDDLINNRIQHRPCTMGLVFHKYFEMEEERVLYPLRRISGNNVVRCAFQSASVARSA